MPLNGSFRSKSRSPLPQSPRPATFLPPSHYAEAGGLTPRRQDSLSDSHSPQTPSEPRRNPAFMPMASNSDSSFEFISKPENKRLSIASSKTSTTSRKRESHLTNLPLVEAQLLPTLRDTIDRMTRPPSRIMAPSTFSRESNEMEESQLSPPAKPLKSALRSPTPRQLKSPRPPLPSTTLPSQNPPIAKNEPASTPKRTRPRSRTDPGPPPVIEGSSKSPRPKIGSSIPRPRINTGLQSASSTPRPRQSGTSGHESSSDLEMRCERESRDQRSLRVVNGVISSESESDGEFSRAGLGLGLGLNAPYQPRSFASKLRARFTGSADGVDEAAERRRKELLGLVKGIDDLEQQVRLSDETDYGSHGDFGAASQPPPRVLVSSSSGTHGDFGRESERGNPSRPLSFWKRSRSHSPAPPREATQKSPSRSPVIRQPLRPASRAEEHHKSEPPSMPAALRRHSIYYADPPPPPISSPPLPETQSADEEEYNLVTQSPESVYDEEDEWPPAPPISVSHLRPHPEHLGIQARNHRHSDDLANSDAVLLALNSRLAAAREREAFGIPPSVSDVGSRERLSYTDSGSELARVAMAQWEEADGGGSSRRGLSCGAENLLRTLSGRTVEAQPARESSWRDRSRDRSGSLLSQEDARRGRVDTHSLAQSASDPSMYEDDDGPPEVSERNSWQTQDVDAVGEHEDAEHSPPRNHKPVEDAWQSTLPASVYASVVDRYGTLEIRRQETIHQLIVSEEAFVARLTTTVNLFVIPLRMQNSKQYIAGVPIEIGKLFDWLEDILHLHTQLFAALRRAQETQQPVIERVAESVLGSFTKRLEVYQPYLARLVGVAGTIARLVADNSSDFGEFVRIQESVKGCGGWTLEALLVDPVMRLGGYPAMFRTLQEETPKTHVDYVPTLVLLHSTESTIQIMTEVKVREDDYDVVKNISERIRGLPCIAKRGLRLLHQGQLLRLGPADDRYHENAPKRAEKAADPLRQRRDRSGSLASSTASSSSDAPDAPLSPRFFDRRSSIPKLKAPESPMLHERRVVDTHSSSQPVQVFVFTDLIVFASASRRKSRHASAAEEWTLLENRGVVKLLGVTQPDDQSDPNPVFALEVIPLDLKRLEESSLSNNATLEIINLRVPSNSSEELYKTWLSAFQQSSKLTVRALALPKNHSTDRAWQDSGSPPSSGLPKSPSLIAQGTVPQKQEREEREWWSRCFHEVLREFQLRDVS
ncbi:hypothetical protein C8F01DRAFT_1101271 [Mycena amicta]|nr:hypothetical protein C8F01DRAFT_1101271 [Mycena amicta]